MENENKIIRSGFDDMWHSHYEPVYPGCRLHSRWHVLYAPTSHSQKLLNDTSHQIDLNDSRYVDRLLD